MDGIKTSFMGIDKMCHIIDSGSVTRNFSIKTFKKCYKILNGSEVLPLPKTFIDIFDHLHEEK